MSTGSRTSGATDWSGHQAGPSDPVPATTVTRDQTPAPGGSEGPVVDREPPAPPIICQHIDCDAFAEWCADVKIDGKRLRWWYICSVHLKEDFGPWVPKTLPAR